MAQSKRLVALATMAGALSAAACGNGSSDPACTPFTGGVVSSNLTLTKACSPYLISEQIAVQSNAILTVEPGVVLKMAPLTSILVGSESAGQIVAEGTATEHIVLTSSNSVPAKGDWPGLRFGDYAMAGNSLKYVDFTACGQIEACVTDGLSMGSNRVSLDHVSFENVGDEAFAIKELNPSSKFAITSSVFKTGAHGALQVPMESFAAIGDGNVFVNGSPIVMTRGSLTTDTTWKDPGTTVIVSEDIGVDGDSTPTLTIGAGMRLEFAASVEFEVAYEKAGKLVIQGTTAAPVIMTSNASTPQKGDWNGIWVYNSGSITASYLNISYGGYPKYSYGGNIALASTPSAASITNSIISDSGDAGLWVSCDARITPVITGTTFSNNVQDAVGPGPGPCP